MGLLVVTLGHVIVGARLTSLTPAVIFLDPTVMQKGIFAFIFVLFSRRYLIFQGLSVGLLFYLNWV